MSKGGTTVDAAEIPEWAENAMKNNINQSAATAGVGYVPYYGADVAALTNPQISAMKNTNDIASAFGLNPGVMNAEGMPMGMPEAETFAGGVKGYSSAGLYEQALADLKANNPEQYAAISNLTYAPVDPGAAGIIRTGDPDIVNTADMSGGMVDGSGAVDAGGGAVGGGVVGGGEMAAGTGLVDIGNTFGISQADGSAIDTGRRSEDDAMGVLAGYNSIANSGASPTGNLVDLGVNWGAEMSDGTVIDLGKTNKNLATGLLDQMYDPNAPQVPMVPNANLGELVDLGKNWGIKKPDGTTINTGRTSMDDATGVLAGFNRIASSDGVPTGELVDLGKEWGAVMSDGSTVNLGKTNKNLAADLLAQYTS